MDEITIMPTPEKYLKAAREYQAVIRILENACGPGGYDDMDVDFTSRIVDELIAAERERVKKECLTICDQEIQMLHNDLSVYPDDVPEIIRKRISELKP